MKNIVEIMESKKAIGISALFLLAALYGVWSGNSAWEISAWGSIIISGFPLAWGAFHSLGKQRRITSGLLITIAIIASIAIGELFAAGEIAWIMAVGELLEHGTVARARRGLKRLLTLCPAMGRRISTDGESLIPVDQLAVGDMIRIKPGEKIPVDGIIRSGHTSVDQSVLTGESHPLERSVGDAVFAGSLNADGSIDVEVTHSSSDSSLAHLIRLVQEAGQKHAPIQREADRWAEWLVPISLIIALLGYITLRFMGYAEGESLVRAVTVLVVFCPCALALATPTSMMAAIGQATHHGVVIKSGEALEALSRISLLACDKTGTLTHGQFSVAVVHTYQGLSETELLANVSALESRSEHPLAKAFAGIDTNGWRVDDFRALPGQGVQGKVNGRYLLCASERAVSEAGAALSKTQEDKLAELRKRGLATILVTGDDGALLGILGLEDAPRSEAASTLAALAPLRTILLTGDHTLAAERLARSLGLHELRAELLPEDKVSSIREWQEQGQRVAMLGDGVNDAPALKQADVGIAMSRLGTDIATEAADISLLHDELTPLPYLLRLSRSTLRCIRFNIAAALGINLVAVILSLGGLLGPTLGALVHNAGSIIVILNAALLYDRKI